MYPKKGGGGEHLKVLASETGTPGAHADPNGTLPPLQTTPQDRNLQRLQAIGSL